MTIEIRGVAEKLIEDRCVWQYSTPMRCKNKSTKLVKWSFNKGVSVCGEHANKLKKAIGYRVEELK